MKNSLTIRILGMLLAALLMFPCAALAEQAAPAQPGSSAGSGTIEVLLRSLGNIGAMNITLSGSYSLNGNDAFRLDGSAELRARAVGSDIWLSLGGISINMGSSMTLTRHQADGLNGLYIEGSPRNKLYCGSLRLTAENGALIPVLLIDIEEYLYGVVPYEMSDSFPIEALKAQAVAARTYALQRRLGRKTRGYDVVDTTADQVFMGFDPAFVNAIAAVDATRGVAGLYNGQYATCYYTASNGGQTAYAHDILNKSVDDGYLAIADDPYDVENPASPVKSLMLRADAYNLPALIEAEMKSAAAEALSAMGYSDETENIFLDEIVSITPHTPLYGDPNRTYSSLTITYRISACPMVPVYSKPTNLDLIHALFGRNTYTPVLLGEEAGDPVVLEQEFTCEIGVFDQLKDELAMKISNIDCELVTVLEQQGEECMEFVIELRRYGHGVGMSQRGAQWMAGQYEMTYDQILSFYYPGLTFESFSFTDDTLPPLSALPEGIVLGSTGTGIQQPELPALREGETYAVVSLSTTWSTLNVRAAASTDAEIKSVLNDGWRVIVVSEENGWAHIRTETVEGYVSSQYLTAE